MMGIETIRSISDHAAWRAAQEAQLPLVCEQPNDVRGIPFLGESYVPQGWRRALWEDLTPPEPRNVYSIDPEDYATFMVDKTGWGAKDEPALTFDELTAYIALQPEGIGWAFIEEGQFQIVVAAYVADPEAEGEYPPEPDPCEECGGIHSDIEECDEELYA